VIKLLQQLGVDVIVLDHHQISVPPPPATAPPPGSKIMKA